MFRVIVLCIYVMMQYVGYRNKYIILKQNHYDDTIIYRRSGYAGSAADRIGRAAVLRWQKIPELMKGLGKGVRSFKEGMNNMEKEIEEEPVKKE